MSPTHQPTGPTGDDPATPEGTVRHTPTSSAVPEADFMLSSAVPYTWYIDAKPATMHPRGGSNHRQRSPRPTRQPRHNPYRRSGHRSHSRPGSPPVNPPRPTSDGELLCTSPRKGPRHQQVDRRQNTTTKHRSGNRRRHGDLREVPDTGMQPSPQRQLGPTPDSRHRETHHRAHP